jgi:hypothetical protein
VSSNQGGRDGGTMELAWEGFQSQNMTERLTCGLEDDAKIILNK